MTAPHAGLCEHCAFHSIVVSSRKELFHLCGKSKSDGAFPKYPRIPVVHCLGFELKNDDEKRDLAS
jgi:hypothetical protein